MVHHITDAQSPRSARRRKIVRYGAVAITAAAVATGIFVVQQNQEDSSED